MRNFTELVSEPSGADPHRATSPPLYQTATFAQSSAVEHAEYDYSRSGNPTRTVLEQKMARLEGGGRSFAFTSGMAAIAAVCGHLREGEEVLAGSDLYGGTFRLLDRRLPLRGVGVSWVDVRDADAVARALRPNTRLVLVESPTNPLLHVADLPAIARACRANGSLLAVDGTLLSPFLQRPLELGASIVVHSATKHLSGHGDLTAGIVTTSDERVAEELAFVQNAEGTALAPFESWLLLRGIKTLGVRMERQQASALRIAVRLTEHPAVRRVHFPGLESHPGHGLLAGQASGAGCVISFETGSFERSRAVVDGTELFRTSVSFGCVGSSISLPGEMSHASIPESVRAARALPRDLVRLSIGLEDPEDLLEDLERVLARSGVLTG